MLETPKMELRGLYISQLKATKEGGLFCSEVALGLCQSITLRCLV
jgi:hypothetical protein